MAHESGDSYEKDGFKFARVLGDLILKPPRSLSFLNCYLFFQPPIFMHRGKQGLETHMGIV